MKKTKDNRGIISLHEKPHQTGLRPMDYTALCERKSNKDCESSEWKHSGVQVINSSTEWGEGYFFHFIMVH